MDPQEIRDELVRITNKLHKLEEALQNRDRGVEALLTECLNGLSRLADGVKEVKNRLG